MFIVEIRKIQKSVFVFLKILCISKAALQREREREAERELPSAGSFPKQLQQPELRWSNGRKELFLGLPPGSGAPTFGASFTLSQEH